MTTLKADNETLKAQVTEKTEELVKLKNVEADLEAFKKSAEDKARADLDKEANDYVESKINDKKIIPASKDMYVKNYISFKNEGEEALKMFKDDIEKRAELLDDSSITNVDTSKMNDKDIDVDKIDELVETKMKNGMKFDDARKEVYASLGMEV